ncbi:MAG: gliding motility-associated C-terminal domain-containing protein, partial [Chitinophagaceae bacterium]
DSVKVRVVDYVTLAAGNDTTICTKDSIRLAPSSDGLRYVWTPNYQLNNSTLKNPQASPLQTTTYLVTAYIGSCFTTDDITIRTVPYPGSNAGVDTSICYQDTAQLHGLIQGINFNWSPISTLSLYQTLDPLAFPLQTTTYTLKVYDTLGCPKPGISQVTVNVYPPIRANAGGDTAVVLGQPLQLKGSGAPFFSWSPPTYLNDPSSPNPIAQLSDNFTYYMKTYNAIGCFDLDTINIRVFKTKPDIFVPNAFMPTGFNKVLRPIAVGLSRLNYFRVYNRWGQLVFQTTSSGIGWDGTLGGQLQDSGTFIWIAAGVDYTGKPIVRKGSAVLIR